jgi:hypothetical protein
MTARNKTDLLSQISTLITTNTTGDISAADVRSVMNDLVDSTLNNTETSAQTIAGDTDFAGGVQSEGEDLRAYSGLQTILFGFSNTDQNPTGTDAPLQISYGAAQGTPTVDEVALDAAGTITLRDPGTYWLRYVHTFGRTGSSGTSILFARTMVDGAQFSTSAEVRLDNANVVTPFEYSFPFVTTTSNVEVSVEFFRSSTGTNAGGLISNTPNLSGWADTNASSVLVGKLV